MAWTMTRDDLLTMSRAELLELVRNGHPIDPRDLDDTEYAGISLGLPQVVEKLTWKKFKKTFHRDPLTGALRGWNVRIQQDSLDDPWVAMYRDGAPKTFGHYEVIDPAGVPMPTDCHGGLLIDYGRGRNRRFEPMNVARDPLVAVNPGSAQLLLGWSYVELGFARFGTPSFFSLEHDGALTHRIAPPLAS